MRKTIVIDLTSVFDHLTGIERFALNTSKCLIDQHPEHNYVLLFKNEVHPFFEQTVKFANVSAKVIKGGNKLIFQQLKLPAELYKIKADARYFPAFTQPWMYRAKGCVNTIHDICDFDCPEGKPKLKVLYARIGMRSAVRKKTKIITVSEFSRGRISEKFGIPASEIGIVYDGITPADGKEKRDANLIREKYSLPEKYFLCVGTLEPRKNLILLIRAYQKLVASGEITTHLALVGRRGWNIAEVLGTDALNDMIHVTGFVDDDDLPAVYKNAEAFIFPSKYEGFGLPPLEAAGFGTCVISSDAASMPEVMGDGALYFESNSEQSLADAILTFRDMSDDEKDALRARGRRRAEMFKWSEQADELERMM